MKISKSFNLEKVLNYFKALFRNRKGVRQEPWRLELQSWRLAVSNSDCIGNGKCVICKCTIPANGIFPGLEQGDAGCEGDCFPFSPTTELGWEGYKNDYVVNEIVADILYSEIFKDCKVPIRFEDKMSSTYVYLGSNNNIIMLSSKENIRALAYQVSRTNIISLKKILIGYEVNRK